MNLINFLRTPFLIHNHKSDQAHYQITVYLYQKDLNRDDNLIISGKLDLNMNWTKILIERVIQLESESKIINYYYTCPLPSLKIEIQYYDQYGNQYQIKPTDVLTCKSTLQELYPLIIIN